MHSLAKKSSRKAKSAPAEPKRRPEFAYLYAIGSESRFIKFGYARDPLERMLDLQVGSPIEHTLLASLQVPYDLASALEKKIHTTAIHHYVRGEWFRACQKTLLIAQWMSEGLDVFEPKIDQLSRNELRNACNSMTESGALRSRLAAPR